MAYRRAQLRHREWADVRGSTVAAGRPRSEQKALHTGLFPSPPVFLFTSTAPGGGVNDYERTFWDVLYQAGAAIVLNGDQHHYERFAPQTPDGLLDFATGIREFVVGTGGADLSAPTSIRAHSEVRNGDTFGVLKLTLAAGRYAWEFIPSAGQRFRDSGRGVCHGSRPRVAPIVDPWAVFTAPDVAKPAYFIPIFPEPFHLKVTRISGDAGSRIAWRAGGSPTWGADARHHYSNDQPWSADGTLLTLQNTGSPHSVYLDGETYQRVRGPCPNDDAYDDRWHPSYAHAHERIAVNRTGTLSWFDVVTCTQTRRRTLPFPVLVTRGTPSDDGRFIALSNGKRFAVVDMDPQPPFAPYPNRRIGPPVDLISDCGLPGCAENWV